MTSMLEVPANNLSRWLLKTFARSQIIFPMKSLVRSRHLFFPELEIIPLQIAKVPVHNAKERTVSAVLSQAENDLLCSEFFDLFYWINSKYTLY